MRNTLHNELGDVRVSDEAIAEIASLAALKVKGVASMGSSGTVDGLASMLGLSSKSRGVVVEMGAREVALSMFLVIEFGSEVAETAGAVQDAVAGAVEKMTGLSVVAVDVVVQGVSLPPAPRGR